MVVICVLYTGNQPIAVYTIQTNGGNDQQLFATSTIKCELNLILLLLFTKNIMYSITWNNVIVDDLPPKYEDIIANSGGGTSYILMPQQQHHVQQAPPTMSTLGTSGNNYSISIAPPYEQITTPVVSTSATASVSR